jgi:hypothetical protein
MEGSERFCHTVLAEAFTVTVAMAERHRRQNAMMDSHTPNLSIGFSPGHVGADGEEEDEWTPVGIVDEQDYAPDCTCDGDDSVNHAGLRDLTDWWNSGKCVQEQYPTLPGAYAMGEYSDVCDDTSEQDPSARCAPPLPRLLASPLARCARTVSCDDGDPTRNAALKDLQMLWKLGNKYDAPSWMQVKEKRSHAEPANLHDDGNNAKDCHDPLRHASLGEDGRLDRDVGCCFTSSMEDEDQADCEYNGWNPGGIADADRGYEPSCPCP